MRAAPQRDVQHQRSIEDAVIFVPRLAREIELGGEDAATRSLHLDVIVPRAAGIKAGDDGLEHEAALRVAELVAAQAVALVIVFAGRIAVPEIEQRAVDRPAAAIEHEAGEGEALARHPVLKQVGALGRIRREIGAFGLARRRLIAVAAL